MSTANQSVGIVSQPVNHNATLKDDSSRFDQKRIAELPTTLIQPQTKWSMEDFYELWRFRELLYFLVWRDVKVRYKQSFLGAAWAIIQPLTMMIVFSLFFGQVAKMPTGGIHYPIFVLAGLLPWFFFSNSLRTSSASVVGNASLVTKIYFPRLLIPLGAGAAGLVDFGVSFGLLAVMMCIYGVSASWGLLLLPLIVILLMAATFGIGILLSAVTVKYRDVRYVVPFLLQLWMFLTPSIYMSGADSFGPLLQSLLPLNPAYGLILNFRAATLGSEFDFYCLAVSGGMSCFMFLVGCWYFRRTERSFADII